MKWLSIVEVGRFGVDSSLGRFVEVCVVCFIFCLVG